MSLLLSIEELKLLKYVLVKNQKPGFWKTENIIKKIDIDILEKETRTLCPHKPSAYIGEKVCCNICGSFFMTGMSESWTQQDIYKRMHQPRAEDTRATKIS